MFKCTNIQIYNYSNIPVAISSTLKRILGAKIFKQPLNKTSRPYLVDVLMVCGKLTAPTRNLDHVIYNIWQDKCYVVFL